MEEGPSAGEAGSGTAAAMRARSGLRPKLEDEAVGRLGRGLAGSWAGPVRSAGKSFFLKHRQTKQRK